MSSGTGFKRFFFCFFFLLVFVCPLDTGCPVISRDLGTEIITEREREERGREREREREREKERYGIVIYRNECYGARVWQKKRKFGI